MRVGPEVRLVQSADGTTIAVHSVGSGEGVLLVGGALSTAQTYLPFARRLAGEFCVHVIERRGRGLSGPLGCDYALERECEDVAAVQAVTGAARIFGHSYGGLIALQTARRGPLEHVAVYEPAVSVGGAIPTGWMSAYERRLAVGDARGAFVEFVRGSGHAPAFLTRTPEWYVQLVLRAAIRGAEWRRMVPLLGANLLEHRQVARFDGDLAYAELTGPVLVLAGARSPRAQTDVLQLLGGALRCGVVEVMPGLDHRAPAGRGAEPVADRVAGFFASPARLPSSESLAPRSDG